MVEDGRLDGGSVKERESGGDETKNTNDNTTIMAMSRKEKRKALKKMKRKQLRRERALKEREEEEARLNDPEERMRLLRLEEEEAARMERDRMEFEERERRFLEALELRKKRQQEEEEERRKLGEESRTKLGVDENTNELDEDDDWEYVEEGPAEIIWKGNEIIVKKKKGRVHKKSLEPQNVKQENDRPISNPLAPQSEAFDDYKSAQEVLESVAQQVPNFGTEQDKAHCPFHLKTGVCRFGARCSRVHFYPDKSCTLLMKNMYNGPGLAWEQDEGLEHTEEEVERSFEDFYEDVHTEFLKFGELVNFKVCKNSSSHLRGNVYVHYKSLESAVLAYQSINGRYYAGKQISCEFINVTRWKVAICGEYMKSRLKTCSRGSSCNFIHCFRNPGGDYEWADWDKPAPRYWVKEMAALFGYAAHRPADEISTSYGSRRSRSRGPDSTHGKSRYDKDDDWKREYQRKHRDDSRKEEQMHEEEMSSRGYHRNKRRKNVTVDMSDDSSPKSSAQEKRSSRKKERDSELRRGDIKIGKYEADYDKYESVKKGGRDRYLEHSSRSSTRTKRMGDEDDDSDGREDFDADRHHDKYHRHKSRHSPHRKDDRDPSDNDSHGDKHRHHSRSKRSSRGVKYEADFSDSDSDSGRDRTRRHRNGRTSRLKNESDIMNTERSRERSYRDKRHHRHGRRSSRHHSKDPGLDSNAYMCHKDGDNLEEKNSLPYNGTDEQYSPCGVPSDEACEAEKEDNIYNGEHRPQINESNEETTSSQLHSSCMDIFRESESECEQAYRLAALKKLEEMRKSKDSLLAHDREHLESARTHAHDNVEVKSEEESKDQNECLDPSKGETRAASMKTRRI